MLRKFLFICALVGLAALGAPQAQAQTSHWNVSVRIVFGVPAGKTPPAPLVVPVSSKVNLADALNDLKAVANVLTPLSSIAAQTYLPLINFNPIAAVQWNIEQVVDPGPNS